MILKKLLNIAGNKDCKTVTVFTVNSDSFKDETKGDIRMNIADSLQKNLGVFCAASTLSDNIVIDAKLTDVRTILSNCRVNISNDIELIKNGEYEKTALASSRFDKAQQQLRVKS